MKKSAIVAIDQGTHATRAMIFDDSGVPLFTAQKEISLHRINDLCVEQNPFEILQSVRSVIEESLANVPQGYFIQSIGIATQRSSIVAFSKNGEALAPMLSWQDRRTIENIKQFAINEPLIKKITGLPLSPHYGASKMRWLLEENPVVFRAFKQNDLRIAPLASYLLANILDEKPYLVDHANASRTLLINLERAQWDDTLLNLFSINRELLPKCVPTSYNFGHIQNIPVKAVTGDQNAAVFSGGTFPENSVLVNVGTGAFVMKPVGKSFVYHDRLLEGLLASEYLGGSLQIDFTLEGTVNGAASALDWARQQLGISGSTDLSELISMANNIPLFVNTVGGIGSPFWKSGGNPRWIPPESDKNSALVAVLESILFYIKINIDEILAKNILIESIIITGGLSNANIFCQRLADLCQLNVHRPEISEATSRGVAYLAAAKPAFWVKNPEKIFEPSRADQAELRNRFERFYNLIVRI